MSSSLFFPIKSSAVLWRKQFYYKFLQLNNSFVFILLFFPFIHLDAQGNMFSENEKFKNLISSTNNVRAISIAQEFDDAETQGNSTDKINTKRVIVAVIYISVGICIIIALVLLIYRKRNNLALHSNYKSLIDKIQKQQKKKDETFLEQDFENTPEYKEPIKNANSITDGTFNTILRKIIKFENSDKYLRKDINLTWLSHHLNTNTKYLSEVIKVHRNKSFNNYINGLRIGYITKKLYENPVYREYKITYLAEECGYASPQVFVIAFKKETGVIPSYFIEKLKNQDIEPEGSIS